MSRLEMIDGSNWRDFTGASQGVAVLMLSKSDCPACSQWTEELGAFLARDPATHQGVRFGKMLLDKPGLADFKRNNLWITSEVDVLPFTVIYRGGKRFKSFAGGGVARLENRLQQAEVAT